MAETQLSRSALNNNAILARLSNQALDSLARHLRPVELPLRQMIYQPHEKIQYAYFVGLGMISVVSVMEDGRCIEVGTIGNEGLAGGTLLLGAKICPYQYFVQLAGHGYRVDAEILKAESEQYPELRRLILRYQETFLTQTMQLAACNGLHTITQRCCRWLLMTHDRMDSHELLLTHEFLGIMLGVRRASVSDVLQPMQERGWVQSKHGVITVLDRKGLESVSCECYRIIVNQQNRMLDLA